MFILTNVGQQCPLWRFIHHLPHYTKLSQIASWKPCKHAVSITESLLRTDCCWLGISLKGFLGHLLQRHFDFCRSFAELPQNFREYIPIRRPQPSAGGASEEKQTSRALAFGSRKASLMEAWLLNFRTIVFDRIWLWRSLAFGSSAATYEGKGTCPSPEYSTTWWTEPQNQTEILWYPSPAGPRVAGGGSPLQVVYVYNTM